MSSLPREAWEEADLGEGRKLLLVMLDAVYVETVEEPAIVALKPKPAFQALSRSPPLGKAEVLFSTKNKESPPNQIPSPQDDSPCLWWRWRRVQAAVPKFLACQDGGEEGNVGRLGLGTYEIFPVDGDAPPGGVRFLRR